MTADFPISRPKTGTPDTLIVFLHGYGASGFDLAGLEAVYRPLFPQAVFVSPHAPIPMPHGGYAWFGLTDLSPDELKTGTHAAYPFLQERLNAWLEAYKIAPERLLLIGFSQGAMLALHAGINLKTAPLGVVAFSGALVDPKFPAGFGANRRFCVAHGQDDAVVPQTASLKAHTLLSVAGATVDTLIVPHCPHTIAEQALQFSQTCLQKWGVVA